MLVKALSLGFSETSSGQADEEETVSLLSSHKSVLVMQNIREVT